MRSVFPAAISELRDSVLPRFREGAWLCELAAVRDPDGVVVTAAVGHADAERERGRVAGQHQPPPIVGRELDVERPAAVVSLLNEPRP